MSVICQSIVALLRHRKEPLGQHGAGEIAAPSVVTCHKAEADQISQERAVIRITCLAAGAAAEVAATASESG